MRSHAAGPVGATGASPQPTQHVRIQAVMPNGYPIGDIHEFPVDPVNSRLRVATVRDVFFEAKALKYKPKDGVTRMCPPNDDEHFEAPDDGWGDRIYYVHIAIQQQQQQPAISHPSERNNILNFTL